MSRAAPAMKTEAVSPSPVFDKCYRYRDAERARQVRLYPFFRALDSGSDPEVTIEGLRMIMLGSNNCLGLANDPRVKEAAVAAVGKDGSSCVGGRLVVVDGVFSMAGDITPLPEIVSAAREFAAGVMVDDAHGIGVLGRTGRGTAEHFGLEAEVDLMMGTFSKAMASIGGFIAADAPVIDYVKHHARTLIFSAAPSPGAAGAALAALAIMESEPERRASLWENTRFFVDALKSIGLDTGQSQTPVVPIVVGDDLVAIMMAQRLHEEGVFVNCVLPPATPRGRALIRTSLMATHTRDQLSRALDAIERIGREVGLVHGVGV